jgi:hypothetical protein
MGRWGTEAELAIEDEYWRLVLAGVGTVEACRMVGIGRNDGLPLACRRRRPAARARG